MDIANEMDNGIYVRIDENVYVRFDDVNQLDEFIIQLVEMSSNLKGEKH